MCPSSFTGCIARHIDHLLSQHLFIFPPVPARLDAPMLGRSWFHFVCHISPFAPSLAPYILDFAPRQIRCYDSVNHVADGDRGVILTILRPRRYSPLSTLPCLSARRSRQCQATTCPAHQCTYRPLYLEGFHWLLVCSAIGPYSRHSFDFLSGRC